MKKPKPQVQFRYYEMPPGSQVLALFGTEWIREYGNDLEALHFHNCIEIGYCKAGGGAIDYGNRKIPYASGSITIVPPNHLHHTNSYIGQKCHWEFLFVDVESILEIHFPRHAHRREQLKRCIYKKAMVLHHENHPQIAALILTIIDEHRMKAEHYNDSVRGILLSLVICLARLCDCETNETKSDESIGTIAPAIEYVTKYYSKKITISMLAEACHLSETHFRRLFSKSMNMSPQEYVNRMRIEAAGKLLHTTNDDIGKIALKCGFSTASAFNRNFKDIFGMSPKQFKKDPQHYARKLGDRQILPFEGWR